MASVLEALARIETTLERRKAGEREEPSPELLQLRLDEILAQIRAVQAERDANDEEWGPERRRRSDLELGGLRQAQARVLFQLNEQPI